MIIKNNNILFFVVAIMFTLSVVFVGTLATTALIDMVRSLIILVKS